MTRKPRTVFTRERIYILGQKFVAGMINHYEVGLIERAASETGLAMNTIKAKHKPTAPRNPTIPRIRIPTAKRALSGYNIFMKKFFQKTKVNGQLEPNTLIEAEGLNANAKARAEALRLETFEEKDASDLTDVEYSSSDRTSDDTVSGVDSEARESEEGSVETSKWWRKFL
ncbi:10069_t:CDS:2, partial [Paraglomus occultum]